MKLGNPLHAIRDRLDLILLLAIIMLGASVRMVYVPSTVADFDPWWYFRHSEDALNYGLNLPKWDILSYAPPGRPYIQFMGVEYMLAITYKIFSVFIKNMSFMQFFILAPAFISGISAVPAYLVGRLMSNKIAGLFTAIFAVLAPTFISYSVSGYLDSKAFVVLYSFLTIYLMMLALKKQKIYYYIAAVLANVLFIYTWAGGGWYPLMAFMVFAPMLPVFRILESMVHQRKFSIDMTHIVTELKKMIIPYMIILVSVNVITQIVGLSNVLQAGILSALYYTGISQPLLVNISVAELQKINIFSSSGFDAVANQVGLITTVATLIGLPLLVVYKLIKKEQVRLEEIFLFLFALITFYMILNGIRFALIFSVAASLSAGYVIGNLYDHIKHKPIVLMAGIFGAVMVFTILLISNAYQLANGVSHGYGLDPGWKEALDWIKANSDNSTIVATWWDPGHIIAGYTGNKVVADGAHCPDSECVTGGINMRIQDMAYVLTTSNETEATSLLKKYMQLTPDECNKVKSAYGDRIYDNVLHQDPCAPLTKMYFIASNDLIGKYYWPRYFSSCIRKFGVQNAKSCYSIPNSWFQKNAQGTNYLQLSYSSRDNAGNLIYGNGVITLAQKNNQIVPILNIPDQGISNAIIQNIVVFNNDQALSFSYSNVTNIIPGTLFVDPSFQAVIYMDPDTSQSLFTKMFFYYGQGLEKFKPVFTNSIIRIYEVEF